MSKTKIILATISICIILILYTYAYQFAYLTTEKSDRIRIDNEIKSNSELPSRFYEIYNLIYPKSLEQGQISYFFNSKFKEKSYKSECPCRIAASDIDWISFYRLSLPQKTFFIESFASQKECLNYIANTTYFGNNIRGVKNASIVLFNKEIDDLDDEEYIEIIIVMENPSLYNRNRRPEVVNKKVNKYLEKINHANKS